jgi:hypothetical protein
MAKRKVVEVWKPVTVREGYEVSNLGRVRSVPRWINSTTGKRYFSTGKILRLQKGPGGYPTVNLGTRFLARYVHQLVMHSFVGPTPKGKQVLHNNDIRTDVRLVNLRFGTAKENYTDAVRNSKHSAGTHNYAERILMSFIPKGKISRAHNTNRRR